MPTNEKKETVKCTVVDTIFYEEKCHHEEICHEEYEVIVTTTVIEECEDIITKHCHNEHKNVYHTTNVVGHDSSVVGHEIGHSYEEHETHNYDKRDADPAKGSNYGSSHHSSEPKCEEHVEKKCHKKPIQDSHKVPHTKCHTVPHCHPVEVVVPREVCVHLHFTKQSIVLICDSSSY